MTCFCGREFSLEYDLGRCLISHLSGVKVAEGADRNRELFALVVKRCWCGERLVIHSLESVIDFARHVLEDWPEHVSSYLSSKLEGKV